MYSDCMKTYMTAKEAAEFLGVSRETLYAYVSRGQLQSESAPGLSRERRYLRADVLELKRRNNVRRDPSIAVEQSLQLGPPILSSGITLIQDGRLFYRGRDVLQLAQNASLEDVAALLWGGDRAVRVSTDRTRRALPQSQRDAKSDDSLTLEQMQLKLVRGSLHDPSGYDLRATSVQRTGWQILALFRQMVSRWTGASDLHEVFQSSWVSRDSSAAEIIRAALVLCADHELNVSAFAARCTASAGASPYDVVLTGLATLKGKRHGGQTEAAAALLSSLTSAKVAKTILYERLRRGEAIPGFGHPLYPKGDCRASFLLDLLYARDSAPRTRLIRSLTETGEDVLGERPNIDWALAAIGHSLALPTEAPLFLFAVSRTVGWIAHAIEQYESGNLIRPRARYVGPHPEPTYQVPDKARELGIR